MLLRHVTFQTRLLMRVSSMSDEMHSAARDFSKHRMRSTNMVMIVGASYDDLARKRFSEVRCRRLLTRAARTNLPLQPISQDTINCRNGRNCGTSNDEAIVAKKCLETLGAR